MGYAGAPLKVSDVLADGKRETSVLMSIGGDEDSDFLDDVEH